MNGDYPTLANGRYEIQECIGFGGMAAVFKCLDRSLKTERAVKVLRPEFMVRKTVRERFTTEAVAMANLSHPNIVHVYDHGLEGMTAFIVMEYLPQGSLQSYLDRNGSLSKPQAISICLDIARALEKAHRQGIIHRDIKPDNILLSSRGAKLSDFGLARMEQDDRKVTKTRAVMGTFPYMPPEQRLSAKKTNAQSDIYALTASLFVMVTGLDPTEIYDDDERKILLESVDLDLKDIITKGCQSKLSDRYADVALLIEDLEHLQSQEEGCAEPLNSTGGASSYQDKKTDLNELINLWSQYTGSQPEKLEATGQAKEINSAAETLIFGSQWDEPEEGLELELENYELDKKESNLPRKEPQTDQKAWLIIIFFFLFLLVSFLTLSVVLSQKGSVSEKGSNSNPNLEGVYLLKEPISNSDQTQFKAAQQAFLTGDYQQAERLLDPIRGKYQNDPMLHNLNALIHVFRGQEELALVSTHEAARLSLETQEPLSSMFILANRSWRELNNPAPLLSQWQDLRKEHNDPMIEVNYFVYARFILKDAFFKEIKQARKNNPDSSALFSAELLALEDFENDESLLTIVEQSMVQFPSATSLMLKRGHLQFRLGKYEAAEENMKQVLIRDKSATMAHTLLAGIKAHQGQEDKRVHHMLMALSDETPSFEQLNFMQQHAQQLAQQGALREAQKLWSFCIDTGLAQDNINMALGCASDRLDTSLWLEDSKEWMEHKSNLQDLLLNSECDAELKKWYTAQLTFIDLNILLKEDKTEDALGLLKSVQNEDPQDLPLDEQKQLLQSMEREIWLYGKDLIQLKDLQSKWGIQSLSEQQSCDEVFVQHRIANSLGQNQRSEQALRSIVEKKCVSESEQEGIIQAKAHYELVRSLLQTNSKSEEHLELLSSFQEFWSEADEDLTLVKEMEQLQEKVKSSKD